MIYLAHIVFLRNYGCQYRVDGGGSGGILFTMTTSYIFQTRIKPMTQGVEGGGTMNCGPVCK